jgi:hypothetical protein
MTSHLNPVNPLPIFKGLLYTIRLLKARVHKSMYIFIIDNRNGLTIVSSPYIIEINAKEFADNRRTSCFTTIF